MDLLTQFKVVGAIIVWICGIIFVHKYRSGQSAIAELKRKELDDEINQKIDENAHTSLDDLIDRENKRPRK